MFTLRDRCDSDQQKNAECSKSTATAAVLGSKSLHTLSCELETVDALIQTFSLNIHSFVPVQQFMSDNQKLDYQCDMSGICQRQISGVYLVYNI